MMTFLIKVFIKQSSRLHGYPIQLTKYVQILPQQQRQTTDTRQLFDNGTRTLIK